MLLHKSHYMTQQVSHGPVSSLIHEGQLDASPIEHSCQGHSKCLNSNITEAARKLQAHSKLTSYNVHGANTSIGLLLHTGLGRGGPLANGVASGPGQLPGEHCISTQQAHES